ncbi:hypothetical protein KSP40_PGU017780 [Platanthera guangdongensis]|uniref:Uncharacterized protein n=1 Tax=Platanthera guangdongensis TaxID=2320717 RepID=A0ABR2LZT3_9ASPA
MLTGAFAADAGGGGSNGSSKLLTELLEEEEVKLRHFIVICGYDAETNEFEIRDPASSRKLTIVQKEGPHRRHVELTNFLTIYCISSLTSSSQACPQAHPMILNLPANPLPRCVELLHSLLASSLCGLQLVRVLGSGGIALSKPGSSDLA